ncbi:HNH endonuclease [Micromonospora costi]
MRSCVTCGKEFDPGGSAVRKYCGKRCKPSGRIAGSVNKRSWVEKLGGQDGWKCWLCELPVDPSLYWPHRWAGSVDHVVHVSNGGTDERSNLRLAHLTCNVSRKNANDAHQP